ncbi:hypothetical protein RYX36_015327 [Vicia faba]
MAITLSSRQLFIDGEWRTPILNNRIPIINPSTENIIGDIPAATKEDVDLAVDAAKRAISRNNGRDWSTASGSLRACYLRAIAAKIKEKKNELGKLESIDSGKPLDEALADLDDVVACFEYYAVLAEGLDSKQKAPISLPMDTFKSHILKEPIGVVALITPWNYPLLMATWKIAPALAAGCAAILKPSELASASITGSKIMTTAAQLVKPVSLELGGKSPILVFEDIDLDKVAEWTVFGCFFTNGQICSATSRLIVHESIAVEFVNKLVKWAENIKISDPLEEGCRLGPIVSEAQYKKVLNMISMAKSEGATILTGGRRPEHLKKGYFVEPTIITNVTTSMQIWREEVFGPVLAVKTFSTEEEAIDLANDT